MKFGYGVDIGGTTVKLGFFREDGKLLRAWEIPTDRRDGGSAILPHIARAVKEHGREAGLKAEDLLGIGLGVPGAVTGRGIVNRCVNLGWGVVDLPRELGALTGLPVRAGNDANLAALGECWQGGGRGYENMVFATLGTGIGGGIIVDGRILAGVHGGGGEIGHIPVNRRETEPCGCGNRGCAEQYGSATGIVRTAKRFLAERKTPSPLRAIAGLTCKDVFDWAKAADPLALEIAEQVYDDLGLFLASVCCVCDPEIIVLGGGVSRAGTMLLDGIRPHFRKYMFHTGKDIAFALACLGSDAGMYGAFRLLLDEGGR